MAEKLKIISLGGLNEIGKNMTVYEYGGDIIVIDVGMGFPDDDMYGIDVVIPDFSYLIKNKDRIRGIFLTHGHEDHIGSIPYLLRDINVPIYATRMTAGLVKLKLEEHRLLNKTKLITCEAGEVVRAGKFTVEFIHVNHSIADACGFAIKCGVGTVVHTGDFKIDPTPIQGGMMDLGRLGQLGKEGVLALLADSTNVERPGFTKSERSVGDSFDALFRGCQQRIIVTTFASNVDRIQQIIDVAARYGRKVAVTGRSMENAMKVSTELGYMKIPDGVLMDLTQIKSLPKHKVCIITTGSQGETMSALSRMAFSTHRQVDIQPGDKVFGPVVCARVTALKVTGVNQFSCDLNTGSETVSLVTACPNLHQGDLVAYNTKADAICTLEDLHADQKEFPHCIPDGIFVLQEEGVKPGDDIKPVIGADDHVVEFEITPNRPDCLSVIGLAREVAATYDAPLTLHEPVVKGGGPGVLTELLDVETPAADLVPRYTARMVRNVKIGPSPKWMRERLRSMGVRPINNIVDITNYVMLEYGQPMHAFDYRYVKGGHIIVRRAEEGEELTTLDGNVRKLTANHLVIADEHRAVGLAGIMGGENSEIVADTATVVFESANFNGTSIRQTALALGLRTEASGKFEKDHSRKQKTVSDRTARAGYLLLLPSVLEKPCV